MFDSAGLLRVVVDRRGNRTTYAYESNAADAGKGQVNGTGLNGIKLAAER